MISFGKTHPPPPPRGHAFGDHARTSSTADRGQAENAGGPDHFIAVSKTDLLEALAGDGRLDKAQTEQFRQVCRRVAAISHYLFFAERERLRDDYFYFDPQIEPPAGLDQATLERAYADLLASLTAVLAEANFVEISHAEIDAAHRQRSALRVETVAPLEDFREVRFFRRGHHQELLETTGWFGRGRKSLQVLVYEDVVLLIAVKQAQRISSRERKRLARGHIRPGSVMIKYFRNVASIDLNALFPNIRVVLSLRDKLLLSGPALAGGVPILLKIASTITVLFLVIGFYFGLSASVAEEQMAGALAALSALIALGGFITRQWLRYQKQSLAYQKELTENIYFRNINNNAGIFDAMIGAAEDQECKEAFLAWHFLQATAGSPKVAELQHGIEAWLKQRFGIEVAFKADQALDRLRRLGLLKREGERPMALPAEEALHVLDRTWADLLTGTPST